MCNRYRMSASDRDLAERYGAPLLDEDLTLPGGELFPKRPAWVVRQSAGERKLDVMKWGLPPDGARPSAVTDRRAAVAFGDRLGLSLQEHHPLTIGYETPFPARR